jgi:hypothetical protein
MYTAIMSVTKLLVVGSSLSSCIPADCLGISWAGRWRSGHRTGHRTGCATPGRCRWGIRTLSASDASYNPVDYQLGSIWPHDNALIVAGMHRYGFSKEANKVLTAVMQAATKFEHFRLPEVFAGYDRSIASKPVKYPVACNPQAWAAGSIPYMLASMLGLHPDGFNRQLHIRNPRLPDWLRWVSVRRVRVADAEVDLRYEQSDQGTLVEVTRKRGDLLVSIES